MGGKPRAKGIPTFMAGVEEMLQKVIGKRYRSTDSEECAIAIHPPVPELDDLERAIGWRFPDDYRRCVELGLAQLDRWFDGHGPDVYDRMLRPEEINEIHTAFQTWVEDCEVHETAEEAAKQQSIRDTLVPFQYLGDGTSWDVYCFVVGDCRDDMPRIIGAYHDDDELHLWLEQPEKDRVYGFDAHIRAWVANHIPQA